MTHPRKQIVNAGSVPVSPYSRAVRAGNFIYLSGTLAQEETGAIAGAGDVGEQTRIVVDRMRKTLTAAGSSLDRVLAVTVYLTSPAHFQAMNDAYRAFWPEAPPTRTTVIADLVLAGALVEISMIAAAPEAERRVIHPRGWLPSPSPYSYAIRSGDTVFLSGLVARDGRDNSVTGGGVAAQTRAVMRNADELLKAAGMSLSNVVSTRVYLTESADFQQMNSEYGGCFTGDPPVRATVRAGLAGPEYLVEMTMIASAAARERIGERGDLPLSAGIRAGEYLYLSGVLGNTPATKGNVAAQTRETLATIRKTLAAAGASPADVVDALVYVTDVGFFSAMNDEYRAFFGKDFPARATVRTGLVAPDGLVEIMVTACAR